MTEESTMMISTPEGKRGRDPDNAVYLNPSPNPQDKKMQRHVHGGKTTSPLDAVLGEIEENPKPTALVASNLMTKFDDEAKDEGTIDLTKEKDEDTNNEAENKNNDNKKEKTTKKETTYDYYNEEDDSEEDDDNKEEQKEDEEDMSTEDPVFCMDFSHGFLKPTDAYKNLARETKQSRTTYTAKDSDHLQTLIIAAPDIFHLPDDIDLPISVEQWHKIFVAAAPILSKKNAKKPYKAFGLTLAGTHPQDLLTQESFDNDRIIESPLACALGGAYLFYGCIWNMDKDFLIDWMAPKIDPTDLWKNKLAIKTRNLALGFSATEIFDEDPKSFHCIEASMAKTMLMKDRGNPEEWSEKIKRHLNVDGQVHLPRPGQGTIKDNLMRIAKTHPTVFKDNIMEDSKLTGSSMTALWTAVYTTLGGSWSKATPVDGFTLVQKKKPGQKKPDLKSSLKKSSFAPDVKDAKPTYASKASFKPTKLTKASSQASGIFLKKQPVTIVKKIGKGPKRKFITFFKVRLPRVSKPFGPEAEAEVVKSAQMLFTIIWKFDSRAVILAYRGSSTATLTKESSPLSSRSQLQLYADNVFVKLDANTWMKIQVAHDKPRTDFEEDENFQGSLQEADLWFHPDKVQARTTSSIGWLLGSTPDSCNINDMKASHEAHPDLGIECEPRPQNIRLYPGKNTIPAEQQVKAIHIYVATENVPLGRSRYGRCYGSRNKNLGNVPDKQLFKFVPECSDPKFPISVTHRSAVIRMMSKQKHLILSTVVIPTSTIAGLHVFLEEVGFTLCHILMCLRLGDDNATPLFLSVAERLWGASGYQVVFTVKRERMNEANLLIPLLSVLIEAKFGSASKQWFTEEARITAEGFYWDEDEQQMKQNDDAATAMDDDDFSLSSDDSYVTNLTAALNLGDVEAPTEGDGGVFDFDLDFVFDDVAPVNQYGDNGSVKTFKNVCEQKSREVRNAEALAKDVNSNSTAKAPLNNITDTTSTTTDTTQGTPSSLTEETPSDPSLEQLMVNNPDLVQQFLKNNPQLFQQTPTTSSTVSPTAGVDGQS
jgi:hypothetical protein